MIYYNNKCKYIFHVKTILEEHVSFDFLISLPNFLFTVSYYVCLFKYSLNVKDVFAYIIVIYHMILSHNLSSSLSHSPSLSLPLFLNILLCLPLHFFLLSPLISVLLISLYSLPINFSLVRSFK